MAVLTRRRNMTARECGGTLNNSRFLAFSLLLVTRTLAFQFGGKSQYQKLPQQLVQTEKDIYTTTLLYDHVFSGVQNKQQQTRLFSKECDADDVQEEELLPSSDISSRHRLHRLNRFLPRSLPRSLAVGLGLGLSAWAGQAQLAQASAPVMALPKTQAQDPMAQALAANERRVVKKQQDELKEMSRQAREIEAQKGESARVQFEREYKEMVKERAEEKAQGLKSLKRNLLEQGIDPFIDLEGQRQVTFYEKGVDLGDVPGTPFHLEKQFERTNYKRSMAYKLSTHRKIISSMVQDMKNRGVDPLEYFESHQDRTEQILNLPLARAQAMLQDITENLETYGQISAPRTGEQSVVEKQVKARAIEATPEEIKAAKEKAELAKKAQEESLKAKAQATKEAEKKAQAAAKAAEVKAKAEQKAAEEKAKAAERARAEKAKAEQMKAEQKAAEEKAKEAEIKAKLAAQEAAKKAKEQAIAAKKKATAVEKAGVAAGAAAAAVAGTAAGVAASAAGVAGSTAAGAAKAAADSTAQIVQKVIVSETLSKPEDSSTETPKPASLDAPKPIPKAKSTKPKVKSKSSKAAAVAKKTKRSSDDEKLPIVPISAFIVAAGGGGYAFKVFNDKKARDEEERQRQFRLIMGMEDNDDDGDGVSFKAPALEEIDMDLTGATTKEPNGVPKAKKSETKVLEPPAPKKRRLGLKSVFAKKRNNRETDIRELVSSGAKAPDYASLLAKILTFGAPGRFPDVVQLPGGMPLEDFDLESAQTQLVEARAEADLKTEESAEIFADVVNCMLIDIVDLASSTLKEKEEKITVDAIDIVVDFMLHAASLYDSVASGVVIEPVTYGGDLSKSKLESMYGIYAGSAMSDIANIREDLDERAALLRDVFQISEKKAEGLMMKAIQKQMMEMMKSGKGLEGLEGMGGMEGMEGLLGMENGIEDGDLSPEQVKEMLLALKQMKDSGTFSKEELDMIKKQFKESFGTSIEELGPDKPLNDEEKELLDMMKSILED